VRRILADRDTKILVSDRAVFEPNIGSRQALETDTWLQADDEAESFDGFLRVSETETSLPRAAVDPAATIALFHISGTSRF
jgi:long-chain acyl-CoA synthetase